MILVFTEGSNDISAYTVFDWIRYFKKECLIINDGTTKIYFKNYKLSKTNIQIELIINGKAFYSGSLSAYYWRRGYLNKSLDNVFINLDLKKYQSLSTHLYFEKEKLSNAIMSNFEIKNKIGSYFDNNNQNKLISLQYAQDTDMDIPSSIITNNINDLKKFIKKAGKVVTKAIFEGLNAEINGKYFLQYTEEITIDDLPNNIDTFFPTLFQEKLDKEYELRIFYLKGKCYSMAIFSQKDSQTTVDFRKYNWEKPNRTVPYKLPKDIEKKLIKFMELSDMDTGSVDLVYTKDKRYVFLEVNPVGQFGMVS